MAKKEKKEAALEQKLKKPIGGKKSKYPSRTAINLIYQPSHKDKDILSLVLFAVFLFALAVFTKFMVLDQLAAVNAAEVAYHEKEDMLRALQKANEEYDEVEVEYSHFGTSYMNTEEIDRQFRTSMIDVINEKVSDNYQIKSVSIAGNTATLTFQVPELRDVSSIVSSLNESPIVSYVTFSTAATEEKKVEAVDERGNVIYDSVRLTLSANITVHFKTPAQVAAAESLKGGEA